MKKTKFTLILLGLIFSIKLSAQDDFKIGINAGINYPDVRGYDSAKYNNFKVGYLIGVSFDYYLTDNLSLKANINYDRKTQKYRLTYFNSSAQEIGNEDFIQVREYINLPILLKYEFGNSRFFANGGPFFNYLFNEKDIEPDYPLEEEEDWGTERKKFDFGISFGIGTTIPINDKNDITLEIRDDLGLIDTGRVPRYLNGTAKTNTIRLIVGWNLGI